MYNVFQSCYFTMCQVSAWQSATLIPISCKSAQPVPARVEESVSPVRRSSIVVVPRTIHPFPGCPKPTRESRQTKMACCCQCVFRHRRRIRQLIQIYWLLLAKNFLSCCVVTFLFLLGYTKPNYFGGKFIPPTLCSDRVRSMSGSQQLQFALRYNLLQCWVDERLSPGKAIVLSQDAQSKYKGK